MQHVGIDSSTLTGFVVLSNDGVVIRGEEIILKNGKKSTASQILQYGRDIVAEIPLDSSITIEGFAYKATGDAVSLQYGIGFAIRYALIDADRDYIEITPSALKKFTTGKGTSKKEIMIKEVYKRWGYEHPSNNVIDAYALAQYGRENWGD